MSFLSFSEHVLPPPVTLDAEASSGSDLDSDLDSDSALLSMHSGMDIDEGEITYSGSIDEELHPQPPATQAFAHGALSPSTSRNVLPPSDVSQPSPRSNTQDPEMHIPPLQDGEVFVRYHPHSKRAPEVVRAYGADVPPSTVPLKTGSAELFVTANIPDTIINKQLFLMRQARSEQPISFQTAANMHEVLRRDLDVQDLGEFVTDTFAVPFGDQERTYKIRYRPALPVLLHLLEDPDLRDSLIWYPDQRFVRHPDKPNEYVRVWREVSSGDDWWKFQTMIGLDGVMIYAHIYADASVVSTFGHTKVWGVYLWSGNIPKDLRNGKGKGRAVLVGHLDSEVGFPGDDPTKLALHRALVYHRSLDFILASLRYPSHFGTLVKASLGILTGYPIIAVASMDYEEMVRAVLILGANSKFPCPICLVPRDALAILTGTWPKRTLEGTKALLGEARGLTTKKVAKAKLQEQSIRDAESAFFKVMNPISSIYDTFICDPLHQIEQGSFGKHIFPWIEGLLNNKAKAAFNTNFKMIPRYPGMHHFPNSVLSLQNISGMEHNIICYGAVHLWLAAGRRHTNLRPCHTDITLRLLEASIARLDAAARAVQGLGSGITFEFPKMHSNAHTVDIIRRKATVDNYHTGLGEGLHPQTKKDYRRSNHQPDSYEDQILRMNMERDAIMHIRARVNASEDQEDDSRPCTVNERVRLGSRQKQQQLFFHLGEVAHLMHKPTTPEDLSCQLLRFLNIVSGLPIEYHALVRHSVSSLIVCSPPN
ncbi:hypothetical protein OF83DRAFT_1173981 [Amylostereum chailletii]|nr:hypothetical protein OF83DRAFT_1173981 [Amylostereum chailletii]